MKNKLNWKITGDCHGVWNKLLYLKDAPDNSEAVIILGDFGANFSESKLEHSRKANLNSWHNFIYAVRGNHDLRPEDIKDHNIIFDENVNGNVYCDLKRYPYIRYFIDGETYEINGHSILVIGGAYSVDKIRRIAFHDIWIKNEQLSNEEMDSIYANVKGKSFDIVLTHTCPFSWQPKDLFLSYLDQSEVDHTMEEWLEKVKNNIKYKIWMFGHFHEDRKIRPGVMMLMYAVIDLEDIYDAWVNDKMENLIGFGYDPNYFLSE